MFRKNFRLYENLHIPFWLVKDTCWALEFKTLGVLMIIPTFTLAIMIAWKTRKQMKEFLPNASIAMWITANSIWMCDEFFLLGIKETCFIPFGTGLACIGYWLIRYFPEVKKEFDRSVSDGK